MLHFKFLQQYKRKHLLCRCEYFNVFYRASMYFIELQCILQSYNTFYRATDLESSPEYQLLTLFIADKVNYNEGFNTKNSEGHNSAKPKQEHPGIQLEKKTNSKIMTLRSCSNI